MITFSKLGRKGNIGNQLFQIASTIGIAKTNGQNFCFPNWNLSQFFENELPLAESLEYSTLLENQFHYEAVLLDEHNYDLDGWFQSENYFDIASTKFFFKFKSVEVDKIKQKYNSLFSKKTILISIRRGDFVDHPDYFQLPIAYYLNALIDNFPDWQNQNLLILSDDIGYCKFHFSFLENAFFAENATVIEQLILGSLCDDFIISNSTFSWWCAWLGEANGGKIVRPFKNFTPEKNKISNDKDFFPDRWISFNHLNKKLNLGDTLITVNKSISIIQTYLDHYFLFLNSDKILDFKGLELDNQKEICTIVIVNNVIVPPFALYAAVLNSKIWNKNYRYNLLGKFVCSSKLIDYKLFSKQFDYGIFTRTLSYRETNQTDKNLFFVLNNKVFDSSNFSPITSEILKSINCEDRFTFAGKISILEFKFFSITTAEKAIIKVKKIIKKVLKLNKK